jgi:hypothetical protein
VNRLPGGIQAAVPQAMGVGVCHTHLEEAFISGGRFLVENASEFSIYVALQKSETFCPKMMLKN